MKLDYDWNRRPAEWNDYGRKYREESDYSSTNNKITEEDKLRTQRMRDLEDRRFLDASIKEVWE